MEGGAVGYKMVEEVVPHDPQRVPSSDDEPLPEGSDGHQFHNLHCPRALSLCDLL